MQYNVHVVCLSCSVTTESGEGFEAYFTTSGQLIVASIIKKKYNSVAVADTHCVTDSLWHCVAVSHSCAKGPFRKSVVTVYIDGKKVLTSELEFPTNKEVSVASCRNQ